MSTRKKISIFMMIAIVIGLLAMQVNTSWSEQQANKLEGAWVARVTSINGEPGDYPFQWSYILSPFSSGNRASLHGSADVPFPDNASLIHDFKSSIIGEVVMTGPYTAAFNTYYYGIKKVPTGTTDVYEYQIVYIGRSWGTSEFLGPDEIEVTHHFEIYLPEADSDGDGIPDPGSTPLPGGVTATSLDTRIPSP